MTAPMAPEELAAIERQHKAAKFSGMCREEFEEASHELVGRLLAEVRRLQAERDAAPPVGQTPDEFALELLGPTAHPELRRRFAVTITARDAEVARAAAERHRKALCGLLMICGEMHSESVYNSLEEIKRARQLLPDIDTSWQSNYGPPRPGAR